MSGILVTLAPVNGSGTKQFNFSSTAVRKLVRLRIPVADFARTWDGHGQAARKLEDDTGLLVWRSGGEYCVSCFGLPDHHGPRIYGEPSYAGPDPTTRNCRCDVLPSTGGDLQVDGTTTIARQAMEDALAKTLQHTLAKAYGAPKRVLTPGAHGYLFNDLAAPAAPRKDEDMARHLDTPRDMAPLAWTTEPEPEPKPEIEHPVTSFYHDPNTGLHGVQTNHQTVGGFLLDVADYFATLRGKSGAALTAGLLPYVVLVANDLNPANRDVPAFQARAMMTPPPWDDQAGQYRGAGCLDPRMELATMDHYRGL